MIYSRRMSFIICCTLNLCCCKSIVSFLHVFCTQNTERSWDQRDQIWLLLALSTGHLPSHCDSFGAKCMRRKLGLVIRNYIFNPKGVHSECYLTTPNCNQAVVKIIFQKASNDWPSLTAEASPVTATKWLFMLKEYQCFVTLIVSFTVFLFSPLSLAECKSLRTFKTDLFTVNK